MNALDKLISIVSPEAAFRREQFRRALASYEAAKPSRLRKTGADNSSGDAVVGRAGPALRGYARQLEQNHDIANGVLNVLVNNTVGPFGISIEPQPKKKDGDIHQSFAEQIMELYKDWCLRPEVTGEHDWVSAQRLACRTWYRDGELLAQLLEGNVPKLDHGTRVPFSVELIESDQMPFEDDFVKNITQGVERNGWGRPQAYHVYKSHPGDAQFYVNMTTRRIPADRMLHPKIVSRIRQARGVSVFASVMRRLEDIKDYEESERVAARISAVLAAYIKKGTPEDYSAPDDGEEDRTFSMTPGMVFDRLKPGEEVSSIQSNRPSALAAPFLNLQHRGVAAGTGASYSSISKNYDGSYSAQRQELVESYGSYQACSQLFSAQFNRPIYRRFVQMSVLAGLLKVPSDLDINTLFDADYRGPAMPWIDPDKEAKANERMEQAGYKSAQMIIRDRGGNPNDVRKQIKQWRDKNDNDGLIFTTDPKHELQNKQSPDESGLSRSDAEEEENSNA